MIYEQLSAWRRESAELAASCRESGLVLNLTTAAIEAQKADYHFLRREVDRVKHHFLALSPGDEC
jgi:hypothetical protein